MNNKITDNDEELQQLLEDAKHGDAFEMKEVAEYYLNAGNIKDAESWYEKAAKKGDIEAMVLLSKILCEHGDNKAGEKWYKKAEKKDRLETYICAYRHTDDEQKKESIIKCVEDFGNEDQAVGKLNEIGIWLRNIDKEKSYRWLEAAKNFYSDAEKFIDKEKSCKWIEYAKEFCSDTEKIIEIYRLSDSYENTKSENMLKEAVHKIISYKLHILENEISDEEDRFEPDALCEIVYQCEEFLPVCIPDYEVFEEDTDLIKIKSVKEVINLCKKYWK